MSDKSDNWKHLSPRGPYNLLDVIAKGKSLEASAADTLPIIGNRTRSKSLAGRASGLKSLRRHGLIRKVGKSWHLTPAGREVLYCLFGN